MVWTGSKLRPRVAGTYSAPVLAPAPPVLLLDTGWTGLALLGESLAKPGVGKILNVHPQYIFHINQVTGTFEPFTHYITDRFW